jgi:hypothetical protein
MVVSTWLITLLSKEKTTEVAEAAAVEEADVAAEVAETEQKVRTDPALKDVAAVVVIAVAEVANVAEEEVAAARDALAKKVMSAPEERAAEAEEDVVP